MMLLGALLLQAVLAGAAGSGESLAVVSPAGRVAVAVERAGTSSAPAVAIGPLALALGGRVSALPNSRFDLQLGELTVELSVGVPFARSGNVVYPLASAPSLGREGELLVPPQLAREILPRLAPEVRWDATASVLRATGRANVAGAPNRTPPQRGTMVASSADTARNDGPTVLPTIRGAGASRSAPPAAASAPRPSARAGASSPGRRYTVVVDAGHGGVDNGMSGPLARGASRIYEKNITLAVSRLVQAELEKRGHDVVMTRTRDTLIALADRGRIANQKKGDLFLSIHVNAANPRWSNAGSARGFETYFLAEARTEDARRVEQMENDAVRFETESDVTVGDPLSFIVTDMQQNEHLRESSDLAATVQRHLSLIHPGPNRGVKQAGFRVLVSAFMPSVLIELGFGTNAAEAAWLSSPAEQARIAGVLADAAEEYLSNFERRASEQP